MDKKDSNLILINKRLLTSFDKILNILNKLPENESIAIILSLIKGLKITPASKIGYTELMKNKLITELINTTSEVIKK